MYKGSLRAPFFICKIVKQLAADVFDVQGERRKDA